VSLWLLAFEDPDRGICLYEDEEEARNSYADAIVNWNCTLFVSVDVLDEVRNGCCR
jgi:hypothetical protein